MKILKGKNTDAKVFTDEIEEQAKKQINKRDARPWDYKKHTSKDYARCSCGKGFYDWGDN